MNDIGRYYRYAEHVVCIVEDPDSPVGKRLFVPHFGSKVPKAVRDRFAPLPKEWRQMIQDALKERNG